MKAEIASKTNALIKKEEYSKESGILKEDLVNFKNDMIKWMFLFWILQIATTFGVLIHYIKK